MLYGEKNKEKLRSMAFGYGTKEEGSVIPKYSLNEESIDPDAARSLIENQLLDEGNSRLNMATFCQTYMEEQAVELMSNTLAKNAIDKSEYPQTAELENRCVNILANLWNAPEGSTGGTTRCTAGCRRRARRGRPSSGFANSPSGSQANTSARSSWRWARTWRATPRHRTLWRCFARRAWP